MSTAARRFPRAKTPRLSRMDVKAVVRHRDGYRCTDCGMTAQEHIDQHGCTLDVHRLVPGSPYTIKGCVTLCRTCHKGKPKSPPGSRSRGEKAIAIPAYLAPLVRACALANRRTIRATVEIAVENFLTARGFWPPPGTSP